MRKLLMKAAAVALFAACKSDGGSSVASDESIPSGAERVPVPSDPKATYYVVGAAGTGNKPVITTMRQGTSGTSFARREFDCGARTWRYLAEGDTLRELESSPKNNQPMSPLVGGSIADVMWQRACAGAKAR